MKHTPGRPMAGRTVLVTGATSGIGRATALGLATMGAHIAITGRGRGRTEDAAREIRAAGGLNVDASFAYQLARRLVGSAVTANALHPGVVRTSFGAEDPARIQRLLIPFLRPVTKSPRQDAATSIHLASSPELEQVSGWYFANRRPTRSSTRSYDQAVAARLWEASADLVRLTAAPVSEAAGNSPPKGISRHRR